MTDYTDPPGMPEDERMTSAQFKVAREFLGFTGDWLADWFSVNPRTVRGWEQGRSPVPTDVCKVMGDFLGEAADIVGDEVEELLEVPGPVYVTFRDDDEYHNAYPKVPYPASWHRALAGRIAQAVPGLRVMYHDDVRPASTNR